MDTHYIWEPNMTTYEYFAADLVLTLMYKCNPIFYLSCFTITFESQG